MAQKLSIIRLETLLVSFLASVEQSIYEKIPEADLCFYLEVDIDDALKRNHERVKDGKRK